MTETRDKKNNIVQIVDSHEENPPILTDYDAIEKSMESPIEVPKAIVDVDMNMNGSVKGRACEKVPDEPVGDELTIRQLKFIEHYCGDMLGNGVQSYLEVYDVDQSKPGWYKTACACSSRLLSNDKVYNKINEMLEDAGLNDNFIDKQLLFLASQHDDKSNKLGAIKELNKIRGRITDKLKIEGSLDILDVTDIASGFDNN